MEISTAVAGKTAEFAVEPVIRQGGYIIHYKSNLHTLQTRVDELKATRERVQNEIDAADKRGENIHLDVENWKKKADETTEKAEELLNDDRAKMKCLLGFCPNLLTRHQLSRKSTKLLEVVVELNGKGVFPSISFAGPAEEVFLMSTKDYEAFESRNLTIKGIIDELSNPDTNKIGVYGIGGVGKTTLVEEVVRRVVEDKLFGDVVMVRDVKENPDIGRIQKEIAEKLGMDSNALESRSIADKARRICGRISNKNTLIVLDDIWSSVDLKAVGLPDVATCKVLLTSRIKELLSSKMGTQKNFQLANLEENECWQLFESKAGEVVKDQRIRTVAAQVANRCGGLPILVVTVASALKESTLPEWRNALKRLKKFEKKGSAEQAFLALEWSYDRLDDEGLKSLFLLCGVIAWKNSIRLEDLLKLAMGLGLLKNVDTVEEARDLLLSLVKKLKGFCLLLDTNSDTAVRMHDLVIDVADNIASRDGRFLSVACGAELKNWTDEGLFGKCSKISIKSDSLAKLSDVLKCQKLEMFHLDYEEYRESLQVPNGFFANMEKLKVLSLRKVKNLASLGFLKNLQALCLDRCEVEDIAVVGELRKLEILTVVDSNIKELPKEIGELTCLRLLDLTRCFYLKVIAPNVLSRLTRLEDLRMRYSSIKWEAEQEGERSNASLSELKHLSLLTALEIDISNPGMLPKDLFFDKLERFYINIGKLHFEESSMNTLKLQFTTGDELDQGLKMLVKRSEYLTLTGGVNVNETAYRLEGDNFRQLKHLQLRKLGTTYIINSKVVFSSLTTLEVTYCDGIKFLFSSSTARSLVQLKTLEIRNCRSMVVIISTQEDDEENNIVNMFSKLESLTLREIPSLVGFCSGSYAGFSSLEEALISNGQSNSTTITKEIEDGDSKDHLGVDNAVLYFLFEEKITFPSLERLRLIELPKLEAVWQNQLAPESFSRLKQVEVQNCSSLINLFVPCITKTLDALKTLSVGSCMSLEVVFKCGGLKFEETHDPSTKELKTFNCCPNLENLIIQGSDKLKYIFQTEERLETVPKFVFPKVTKLSLLKLPQFKNIYPGTHVSQWPSLQKLNVMECGEVEIIDWELSVYQEKQKSVSHSNPIEQPLILIEKVVFSNLTTLEVTDCDGIKFLFLSSTARSLVQLRTLTISQCRSMVVIISTQEDDEENNIVNMFSKLESLTLRKLPSLVGFCSGSYAGFSSLEEALISNGRSNSTTITKEIEDGDSKDHLGVDNAVHYFLFDKKVVFSSLTTLKVIGCDGIKFLFSSSTARSLVQLRTLTIIGCRSMVEIVSTQEDEEKNNIATMFSKLESLALIQLPSLIGFCSGSYAGFSSLEEALISNGQSKSTTITKEIEDGDLKDHLGVDNVVHYFLFDKKVVFSSLTTLEVTNCDGIKFLFLSSTARSLVQLRTLTISQCKSMVVIISTQEDDEENNIVNMFSKLESLTLRELPSLVGFCSGSYAGFSSLEEALISNGRSNSTTITKEIEDGDSKDHLGVDNAVHYFVFDKKVVFSSLTTLEVTDCDGIKFLFSSSTARSLVQLKTLKICNCRSMVVIISTQEDDEENNIVNMFSKLESLTLRELPSLVGFCSGSYAGFSSLEEALISNGQSKSTTITKEIEDGDSKDHLGVDNAVHYFLFDEKVTFPSLEILWLTKLPKLEAVWQNQLAPDSFCRIRKVYVFSCPSLINLFVPCITERLDALETLNVESCPSLEVVFKCGRLKFKETQDPSTKELKTFNCCPNVKEFSIHGSDKLKYIFQTEERLETVPEFVFPKVTKLNLCNLPQFKSIYPGTHVSQWPSLQNLSVDECGEVKIIAGELSVYLEKQESASHSNPIEQPLILIEKGSSLFPSLETLTLGAMEMWSGPPPAQVCSKVKLVDVHGATFSKHAAFLQRLHNLKKISLWGGRNHHCREAFVDEGNSGAEIHPVGIFPQVMILTLHSLNGIMHIGTESSQSAVPVFPKFVGLRVRYCSRLKNLDSSTISFQNLISLTVDSLDGLKYLVSHRIARSLMQLTRLKIRCCKRMGVIVATEEDDDELAFSRLQHLEFFDVPHLRGLCSGNCILKLPSLETLSISRRLKSKLFSHDEIRCDIYYKWYDTDVEDAPADDVDGGDDNEVNDNGDGNDKKDDEDSACDAIDRLWSNLLHLLLRLTWEQTQTRLRNSSVEVTQNL